MNRILGLLLLLFIFDISYAQSGKAMKHTVFLIGDAGAHDSPGPALRALKAEIDATPNSTVVFLGDNIYPRGYYEDSSKLAKKYNNRLIKAQVDILKEYDGNAYFIPGNHDWKKGRGGGMKFVKRQADYIKSQPNANIKFLPNDGKVGPEIIDNSPFFKLILFDSQHVLHQAHVPSFFQKGSKKNMETALARIEEEISSSDVPVLIVSHHPVFSIGEHGSRPYQKLGTLLSKYLLNIVPPLQLIGSSRLTVQDISSNRYYWLNQKIRNMVDNLGTDDLRRKVTFAAGHEHNLQYWKYNASHHIVSGSGSKTSHYIKKNIGHKWNKAKIQYPILSNEKEEAHLGYVKVSYNKEGQFSIHAITINSASGKQKSIPLKTIY